jgi:DNA-binding NarL/FixJ family response regulator
LHHLTVVGASWVRALLLGGLLDRADQAARRYRERFQDTSGPGEVITSFMCGHVATCRGQVATAARWYRQAIAAAQCADPGSWRFLGLVGLTKALGMGGDSTSAREITTQLVARDLTCRYQEPEMLLARAWVVAAEGAVSQAIGLARQAAEVAASQQQPAAEAVALHTAVQFGDRTVADRLVQLAAQVDGPRAAAAAAHAAALAADDAPGLLEASVQLEQMGAMLLAADAAAHAAAVHTRQGRRGPAQAATARAHRLAQACEGARTPALAALAAPPPLTTREREILTLAARGLSNRQIAEQLVVSVRTVENHLYRARTKLGAPDRAQLADLLHGH